ncbi:hypothetical protein DRB07_03555 [Actinomyces sp. Z3]|nr:hypothetical protein DRB07_03555 [Actinomyces sp. Z3]
MSGAEVSAPAVVHGGVFAVSGNGGGYGVWGCWDVWGWRGTRQMVTIRSTVQRLVHFDPDFSA